jgi:hypothetical protein
MNNTIRSSSILDLIGVAAIAVAAAALAGILWFANVVPENILFGTFHGFLALGLGSFAIGRVLELTRVVIATPDPKTLRAQRQVDQAAVIVSAPSNVTEGKFSKAA